MKKIFIFFLLTSCHLYGADSTAVIFKRWSIGLSFSPDYSYRVLKSLPSNSAYYTEYYKTCVDSINIVEKATVSYSIGIPISYKFNKLFALKTGVYLSNKTVQSKGFVWGNGFYMGYSIFKSDQWEKSSFLFLEIPIALELALQSKNSKKLSYKIFTGITFCNNIQKHSYTSRRWLPGFGSAALESSYSAFYADKFKLLYIGYTVGISTVYKLNEKLNMGIEPVFKFYGKEFNSAQTTGDFFSGKLAGYYEKPYSVGCNISVSYMF